MFLNLIISDLDVNKKNIKKKRLYKHLIILLFVMGFSLFLFKYYNVSPPLSITGMAASQIGNLSASVSTFISCTWSNQALQISFGNSLTPGINDINATQNYGGVGNGTLYNVTVDTLSNVNANITIKGTDLTFGINIIGVSNVSWISNTTMSNASNMIASNSIELTSSFNTVNQIASNEPIGSTVWYRFWLDVPTGQIAGTYTGNYTQQCQQA